MKREEFFDKFELLAEIPAAIPKLRILILQLAVQGKLVVQSKADGRAADIFAAEPIVVSKGVESRHEVPKSWLWISFAAVGDQRLGKMLDQKGNRGELKPYLRNTNVQWMRFELDDIKQLRLEHSELEEFRLHAGDLLICEGGEPGRCAIWRNQKHEMYFQKALHRVRPRAGILVEYLAINLRADASNGVLAQHFTGATIKHLTGRSLDEYAIPIPPLAEQKRIVAKVDELMALCDRLEAQQKERESRHAALARASLSRFADAPTPANLTFLFHKSYTIPPADLRKSILSLAVRGKLLPQKSSDTPVEELLERTLAERRAGKRTNATKTLILGSESALGYDIPDSWRWMTLDELLIFGPTNGISPKAVDHETPVRSLTLSATTSGRFKGEHSKFIAIDVPRASELWLRDGDVLVQRGNTFEYVGVAVVYRGKSHHFIYPDLMMKLRVASTLETAFVVLAMKEDSARDFLRTRASGTSGSMPKINQTTLKGLPLPIPPLAEQRRIVAKVDQLMALVDELEAQLAASRDTAAKLLDAIVGELTA